MDKIDYESYQGFMAQDADLSLLRDKNNRMRTRSLFYEAFDYRAKESGLSPIYTLSEDTKYGLPPFWKVYMSCSTEYEAACKLVGGIRHWDALLNTKWFLNPTLRDMNGNYVLGLEKWREYKEQQDQAFAKTVLINLAKQGNVAAAKALLVPDKLAEAKPVAKRKKEEDEVGAHMDSEGQAIMNDAKLLKLIK